MLFTRAVLELATELLFGFLHGCWICDGQQHPCLSTLNKNLTFQTFIQVSSSATIKFKEKFQMPTFALIYR